MKSETQMTTEGEMETKITDLAKIKQKNEYLYIIFISFKFIICV